MGRSKVGRVRKLRDGVWEVSCRHGYRRDGKPREKSVTVHGSERDAHIRAAALAMEMGADPSIGDPLTLEEYYLGVFLPLKERTQSKATAEFYRVAWRRLAQDFATVPLSSLTNNRIQRWIDGLPPQSARSYVSALRSALNQAAFDHFIDVSPMGPQYRYRLPRRDNRPLPVWGPSEVTAAIDLLDGHPIRPLWLVMVGGGLSLSEALALDRESIEWADADGGPMARVTVSRAYTRHEGMKAPKNGRRYRVTIVPPMFAGPLAEDVRGKTGPLLVCRYGGHAGERMGGNGAGSMWRKLFGEGKPLEGMPYAPLNRMRATYSTLMQMAGVDSTLINAMQGRSANSRVLYSNYLNPFERSFAEAAARMQGATSRDETGWSAD